MDVVSDIQVLENIEVIENDKIKSIIKDYFIVNALSINAYYFTRGD